MVVVVVVLLLLLVMEMRGWGRRERESKQAELSCAETCCISKLLQTTHYQHGRMSARAGDDMEAARRRGEPEAVAI